MMHATRAARNRGFQIHAFIFVATIALLVVLNVSKGEPYWVLWPIFGWGIGLLAHWWFALGPAAGVDTSDR